MKLTRTQAAIAIVAGAVVIGGGGAAAGMASNHAPAAAQSPAAATAPLAAAPAASPSAAHKAPAKPHKKAAKPATTNNGTIYNGPVTIINQAPQPGSSVYVPFPSEVPYYVSTNQAVVQQYYDYLNGKNFAQAWSMGGDNIGGSDYASWKAGYSTTSWITLGTWDYYPGYNAVGVTISATQSDGSVRTYSGSYTVSNGVITSASIVQDSGSTGSSSGYNPDPGSGLRYVGNGVYAGPNTSDSFALAVQQAYEDGGYWNQPGTSQFYVTSSVTGQTYLMTSSSVGDPVIVTGGNNALVEFNH